MIEELVIPDVPDDIVRLLTEIAMQNNHTLEEEVKDLLYRTARRAMLKRELGRQMSIISEDASCSIWAWRIEDQLPPLLQQAAVSQQPVHYDGVELSPLHANWLVSMAEELGHWVTKGPGGEYAPHVPTKASSGLAE